MNKGLTIYDYSEYLMQINDAYGDNIESQREIRFAIDSIFDTTSYVMKYQFILFCFGFLIPFLLQLVVFRDAMSVMICIIVCMLTQLIFLGIEILQMQHRGAEYFSDGWNKLDCSLFVLFVIYFIIRMADPTMEIVPITGPVVTKDGTVPDISPWVMLMWIVMNTLLLLNTCMKLMFFLRVYESFGMLVQLILQVLQDIFNFSLFFFSWLLLFSLLYRVNGTTVPAGDYPDVNSYIYYMLQIYRNSVGDV